MPGLRCSWRSVALTRNIVTVSPERFPWRGSVVAVKVRWLRRQSIPGVTCLPTQVCSSCVKASCVPGVPASVEGPQVDGLAMPVEDARVLRMSSICEEFKLRAQADQTASEMYHR